MSDGLKRTNIKPPRVAAWLFRKIVRFHDYDFALGDLTEVYSAQVEEGGSFHAARWLWREIMMSLPRFFRTTVIWRFVMFRNYFKIAIRNFSKQKLFSFINVFGLALGMAACLVIFLWVRDELSFDRFHQKAERIYRVERFIRHQDFHDFVGLTSGMYGPTLEADYPEIEKQVRIDENRLLLKDYQNLSRTETVWFADPSLFHIFDFHLEEGDPGTALASPRTLVLTRTMALQLLGPDDAVGKTLPVQWNGEYVDFQVTGILQEIPRNSHVRFNMLASMSTYDPQRLSLWLANTLHTYILTGENVPKAQLETKFPEFVRKYMTEDLLKFLPEGTDVNKVYAVRLRPLLDIHLNPVERFEIAPQGSSSSVYLFSSIAAMILVIACINFMNLSTARAAKRAREVGIRKTVGADRRQLWGQFLGESIIAACLALILALMLVMACLPLFNTISGKAMSVATLFSSWNWLSLLIITVVTGVLAGLYPAFCLTAFKPVNVLKGTVVQGSGRTGFRRITAVIQFVISIALIIGTLTVYKQMMYVQNKSLGFDKENVLLIRAANARVRESYDVYRNALLDDPRIALVSGTSNFPGDDSYSDTMWKRGDREEKVNIHFMSADYDFVETMGMTMLSGRDLSREFATDIEDAVMINKAAAHRLGYEPEEAVGKSIFVAQTIDEYAEMNVIGVIEDYHFKSLHYEIEPLAIFYIPPFMRHIAVRILPGDVRGAVGFIQQTWKDTFPGETFQYEFLDDHLQLHYESERSMGNLFLIFSCMSVFVACLGLLGLAAFMAEEKTKEIGIRKAIGASSGSILVLLSKEFTKWVLIANIAAWPLAWFVMNKWLQNFAYKTEVGVATFVISGIVALLVALLTVSYQSMRAALANPVDSLKYE